MGEGRWRDAGDGAGRGRRGTRAGAGWLGSGIVTTAEPHQGALTRYRVMAYLTGVLLLVLVLVAMPAKYLGGNPTPVRIVGPVHGWLYFLYLLSALDLAHRRKWRPVQTLLVLVAGTIPLASFFAERAVTRDARARQRSAA